MQEHGIDIYVNMLQVEGSREIGFFINSFIMMDLHRMKEKMEAKIYLIEVSLCYKAVYRGK